MGCPYCGHENAESARFCANPLCGRYLETTPRAAPAPLPPPHAFDSQVASGGAAPLPGTQAPAAGDGPGVPPAAAPNASPTPVESTPFDPPGFDAPTPVAGA